MRAWFALTVYSFTEHIVSLDNLEYTDAFLMNLKCYPKILKWVRVMQISLTLIIEIQFVNTLNSCLSLPSFSLSFLASAFFYRSLSIFPRPSFSFLIFHSHNFSPIYLSFSVCLCLPIRLIPCAVSKDCCYMTMVYKTQKPLINYRFHCLLDSDNGAMKPFVLLYTTR